MKGFSLEEANKHAAGRKQQGTPHNIGVGKAKEILRHGEVHDKPITGKQKKFFGFIAGGGKPTKV